MRISVNHAFERRLGLFPAGFDEDGVLFCNQNFADYPLRVPDRPFDPWKEASPSWMLLSYRTAATASSSSAGHGPELAVNEDVRTWWVADSLHPGEWIRVDLGEVKTVHAIQVNLADHELAKVAPPAPDSRELSFERRGIYTDTSPAELLIETSVDGESWTAVIDARDAGRDMPHAFVVLDQARGVRHVRVTAGQLPFGGAFAVSGLRVFGVGSGRAPDPVTPRATWVSDRRALIEWDAADDAQGYNVRYGLASGKLYHSWLLYEQTDLDLRALNAGAVYWVAVDSFNENGVTPGRPAPIGRPS